MNKITCIIPVFNGERYIEETLRCVAAQTRLPDRLIILDNCSTDSTRAIVENFKPLKAEWIQNERNLGLFGNFNRALEFATQTEILHLLMADDLVLPTFYEKSLAALEGRVGRCLAYVFNETIDGKSKVIGPRARRSSGPVRQVPPFEFLQRHSELDTVLLPGVMFKVDGQPTPCKFRELGQVADVVFLAEFALHCNSIVEIPEYLCQYRLHPFNTTSANMRKVEDWVVGEWTAMDLVSGWIKEASLAKSMRRQKLKCLFSARSKVKMQMMQKAPDIARQIELATRARVSPMHWWLGNSAVAARDIVSRLKGDRHDRMEAFTPQ